LKTVAGRERRGLSGETRRITKVWFSGRGPTVHSRRKKQHRKVRVWGAQTVTRSKFANVEKEDQRGKKDRDAKYGVDARVGGGRLGQTGEKNNREKTVGGGPPERGEQSKEKSISGAKRFGETRGWKSRRGEKKKEKNAAARKGRVV